VLRSLRTRPLVAAVAAVLVARTATNGSWRIVYPFLHEIADGLGVSLATVGALLFVRSVAALTAPAVPRVIDRAGHRRVMLAALAGVVAGSAVMAATGAARPGAWSLAGAAAGFVVLGLAKPLFDVPMQGWLGARVPAERRGRVIGVTELAWGLGLAVAFPAAWLITDFGWTAMFWLVAGLAGAGAVAVALGLPRHDPAAPTPAKLPLADLRGPLGALVVVVVLFRLAAELLFVVYGPWLEADLGLVVTAIGAFTLIVVASELAGEGAVAAVGDRLGLRRMALIGLVGTTAAYASLGLVGGSFAAAVAVVVAWFVLFEVTIVATIPLAIGLGQTRRERLMSLIATVNVATTGVGALIGPALFSVAGIWLNGLVAAACTAAAAAVLTARVPAGAPTPSPPS
jgi:predicted MFS family arabinose efflux permease